MLFVVGLGNPGRQYEGTRHNVGYEVVDKLAGRHGFPAERSFKGALISRGHIGAEEVLIVKPMTYMNLSGDAVGAIVRYYKTEQSEVIVVHDDLDFDVGEVRIKSGGGHGGHKGLHSIMSHVGREFVRVRVGIGKPCGTTDGSEWVLSRFGNASRPAIDDAIGRAADAVQAVICEGIRKAMNTFNRRLGKLEDEKESEGLS
jgi:PTH1 family peptidyl-tRNA hydrolase